MKPSYFNLDDLESDNAPKATSMQRFSSLSFIPSFQNDVKTDSKKKHRATLKRCNYRFSIPRGESDEEKKSCDDNLKFGKYVSTSDDSTADFCSSDNNCENKINESVLRNSYLKDFIEYNTDEDDSFIESKQNNGERNFIRTNSDVSNILDEMISNENDYNTIEDEEIDSMLHFSSS